MWDELYHNLTRTPQRAKTEREQEESLEKDKLVGFLNRNLPGGDWKEHAKSGGNPADWAVDAFPALRGYRAAKAAR